MRSYLKLDTPVMDFLGKLADLFILNLLWIVCSLPILTMGAATTALYRGVIRLIRGEGTAFSNFLGTFRREFWQSTLLGLLFLILTADVVVIALMVNAYGQQYAAFVWPVLLLMMILVQFSAAYAFPLVACCKNTTKKLLLNAVMMSFRFLPRTILLVLLNSLPVLLALFVPQVFIYAYSYFLTIGFALTAYLNATQLVKLFGLEAEASAATEERIYGGS